MQVVHNTLKEWAYLNPRTFVPKVEVLERYGVKPKEYMFLREVTVGTINYAGQESGAILGIKDMIPKGMKVLLSLEEKKRRSEYPEDWILLQEPIEDIHSLIYYAAGLVSSGDSMAREAALLGVPAYYLGIRYTMPANKAASKVAGLQNRQTMAFERWINDLKKKEESSDTCSISTVLTPQSTHKQAYGLLDDSSRSDIVAQSLHDDSSEKSSDQTSDCEKSEKRYAGCGDESNLPDYSRKIVVSDNCEKSEKRSHADVMLARQRELREHIDKEFIDINAYMLNLVENVKTK